MMYHHSDLPYSVAAEKVSQTLRERFEKQIEEGKETTLKAVEAVQREAPTNNFVWHNDVSVEVGGQEYKVSGEFKTPGREKESKTFTLHRNAVQQAANAGGIPMTFVDKCFKDGQFPLIEEMFNTRLNKLPLLEKSQRPRRFNFRTVGDEARCCVSDAFPLWDSAKLIEAFISSVVDRGGLLIDGKYTGLQFSLKAVYPVLFEPAKGEVMLFGIGFRRSDYGLKPLCMESVVNRPWCTNLATMESVYTRKNLASRYDDADTFTQDTMDKETDAHASAIRDMVDKYLSPQFLGMQAEIIKSACDTEIASISDALKGLKGKITEKEAETVKEYYESKDDGNLPAGNTAWRLSNALSLLSRSAEPDRVFQLEQVAGEVAGLRAA